MWTRPSTPGAISTNAPNGWSRTILPFTLLALCQLGDRVAPRIVAERLQRQADPLFLFALRRLDLEHDDVDALGRATRCPRASRRASG